MIESMQTYKILLKGGQGEIVEKKSRFIATIEPVSTEEEAAALLNLQKRNTGMQGITVQQ